MRRVLGERRVGHAGTLDPFATGLLLVAEGRATALLGCLSLLPKRYLARARLGIATDTQDRTGVPIKTSKVLPREEEVLAAVGNLSRTTRQRPPQYSAVKVRGERLYKAARRGETLEAEERSIRIYQLTADTAAWPDLDLDLTVSRGTYVRTLAHDLGEALGCGAHLVSLRRIASGPFHVSEALSPDTDPGATESDLRARARTPAVAVSHLPRVTLTAEESSRLRNGRAPTIAAERIEPALVSYPPPPGENGWPLALLAEDGSLLALAAGVEATAKLLRVFA
jgi:tRNA pseudouridine55 synthase